MHLTNTFKFKPLILGLCIGLFGVIISLTPSGQALEEEFGLSWLFHFRGAIPAPNDVIIIAIDQPSATQLNLPIKPSSWPRILHAHLIERLSQAGARVIVFDLVFNTPDNNSKIDKRLADAMKKAGNVVIVERLDFEETKLPVNPTDMLHFSINKEQAAPLVPIIADAALAHAPFILPKTSNVNAYWTFKVSAGDAPTLPVFALQIFAQPVLQDFVRLLDNINPEYVTQLSLQQNDLDIEDLIFGLRNIFMSNPTIKKQMQAQLKQDASLNADQKYLIKSLLNLYEGDEMHYLNFYGPPRSVQTIPYYQAMQSAGSVFKDKVVFIGFSAATHAEQDRVRDDYHTIFTRSDGLTISGVEIAATAFANLLDNQPIRPFQFSGGLALIFLFGLGIGAGFLIQPNWRATVLGGFLIIMYAAHVYYQFKELNIWLPVAIPFLLQIPLALFGATLLRYYQARYERQQLKVIFGHFIPDRVINNFISSAGPIVSNNQLVYGTCLATDAEMYTSLAEKMAPHQLSLLMNDYYAELFEPVRRHNGMVSDVIGDAMLAIWATTFPSAALRKQACLASLDIASAVDRFNQASNRPPLATRIGLHFGDMLLGSIGAGHHYEYRAIGDMVNTTNRIQGANKYLGTRLLLSTAVVAGLDDFLTRPLGDFLLSGKSIAIGLAELITHRHNATKEQLWLCDRFARALHAYQSQQWREACIGFSGIIKVFPNDGPARFFLTDCQKYLLSPPGSSWSSTIRIAGK